MGINAKTIKSGTILYRYDIVSPPYDWNDEYKSPIYNNYQNDNGPKNAIGAFFFYDDKAIAIDVARNVLKQNEREKEDNQNTDIWLTTTNILEDIYMLDLSGCSDIVDLYVGLWKEKIDIFRKDFYNRFGGHPIKTLSQIKKDVQHVAADNGKNIFEYKCNIYNLYDTFEDENILPYACQVLTDFSNGGIFKELLKKKGYEGYIFRETDANTFCIFHPNKLSKPQCNMCEI